MVKTIQKLKSKCRIRVVGAVSSSVSHWLDCSERERSQQYCRRAYGSNVLQRTVLFTTHRYRPACRADIMRTSSSFTSHARRPDTTPTRLSCLVWYGSVSGLVWPSLWIGHNSIGPRNNSAHCKSHVTLGVNYSVKVGMHAYRLRHNTTVCLQLQK